MGTRATIAVQDRRRPLSRRACIALLLVVLGGAALLAASPSHATTVTGTFQYRDTNPVNGTTTDRPIVDAKVEIWRFRNRGIFWTWDKDADATTDANGRISINMPFVEDGVIYALRVFATNSAAVVWPNDAVHTMPFHREPGDDDNARIHRTEHAPSDVLDFSYTFHSWSSQHFNIADVARIGKAYADARRGETDVIPPAAFQPTSVTGSWYNAPFDTVVINSADVNFDFLILHEYAHFLGEMISTFAPIPTSHDGCVATQLGFNANSPEHAWMEGWADYYAQAVGLAAPAGSLTGRTGTPAASTLESPACPGLPAGIPGDAVEHFAAGTLWDLLDQPGDTGAGSEAHDSLSRFDRQIFQIFDRELDNGPWPTITAFRSAWMARGLPGIELGRIMRQLGIPLRTNFRPTANAGADQNANEGALVTLDGNGSSDPDLNPLNYTWTQVSGPAVALFDRSGPTPRFTAPRLSSGSATLGFRLVVDDGSLPSVADDVAVEVFDTGDLQVRRSPAQVTVLEGTRRSGGAGRLAADDNSYFEVNSTTTGTRRASWYGSFPAVDNALDDLRIRYKGKNSAACLQTVAVFRWTDSSWVPVSVRSVGTAEVLIANLVPNGAAEDYVSGAAGPGQVRVRVSCTSGSAFRTSADQLRIAYALP